MERLWHAWSTPIVLGLLAALAGASMFVSAQQPASAQGSGAAGRADIVLTGGKVITVDDKFSIAQAVAIRGDRIRRGRHEPADQRAGRSDTRDGSICAAVR